jgi:hypothetical protein
MTETTVRSSINVNPDSQRAPRQLRLADARAASVPPAASKGFAALLISYGPFDVQLYRRLRWLIDAKGQHGLSTLGSVRRENYEPAQ